jgi:dTDP-glucose 4,6-dehydratase
MKILITGGCGFIGHHAVEHFLKTTTWDIVILDKLTYAASGFDRVRNIKAFDDKRVTFFTTDITRPIPHGVIQETKDVDYILHLAAETHVDNSIDDPEPFVMSNVVGTMHMLEYAKKLEDLRGFNYFSTDEVFGPAPKDINYVEWDRYNSTNPYAATKAGGEELVLAYANTYRIPVFITHGMNCFGERQHPEKFIPKIVRKVLEGKVVTIHSDSTKTIPGSRFYIHCRNVAHALHFLLDRFQFREKYNIVGEKEVTNLELALLIAEILEKPLEYELVDFHSSRPGHDLRYALDGTKMEDMGWQLPVDFEKSLERTVKWYFKTKENKKWLYL